MRKTVMLYSNNNDKDQSAQYAQTDPCHCCF